MKKRTCNVRVSLISFAFVAGLVGLFYSVADFGKALPKGCGLLQLVGAIILCFAILRKPVMGKLCICVVVAITLGQGVALFNWVIWHSVVAGFLGRTLRLGWFGFLFHAAFAAWGIVLTRKISYL